MQRQLLVDPFGYSRARRRTCGASATHVPCSKASFEPATFRASGSGGFFPGTLIIKNTGDRSSGSADVEFYVAAAVCSQGLCWEDEQARQDRARARVARGVVFTDDFGIRHVHYDLTGRSTPSRRRCPRACASFCR
jgi:hypothetical protein